MAILRKWGSVLVVLLISGIACTTYYSEQEDDFPNKVWEKDRVLTFKPEIRDKSAKYDLYLDFRHVYGFHFSHVRLKLERVAPDGTVNKRTERFQVRKDKETYVGDCSGDICDLRVPLRRGVEFPQEGTYVYRLSPSMGKYEKIPNVMGVGLVLKKQGK